MSQRVAQWCLVLSIRTLELNGDTGNLLPTLYDLRDARAALKLIADTRPGGAGRCANDELGDCLQPEKPEKT